MIATKRLDRLGVIASCACFFGAAERAPGTDAAVWRPEEWSIRILGYLFGGSPGDETLPPPWPEPGTDPTTDDLDCAGS